MDAISRNTASVAQDFHKAGGVHELKIPANHQLLFNNKLPSQWTTKEAAALLHSLSNATHTNFNNFAYYQQEEQQQQQLNERSKFNSNGFYNHQIQQNGNHLRTRQHSTGEDDVNTPSSASSTASSDGVSPMRLQRRAHQQRPNEDRKPKEIIAANEQRRAMTAFLSKNFDLQEANNNSSSNNITNNNNKRKYQQYSVQDENVYERELEDQENKVQLIRSPPAYNNNYKSNSRVKQRQPQQQQQQQHLHYQQRNASNLNRAESQSHRLELFKDRHRDKENQAATYLTQMEYQNLNKIGTQFQNYVKDIINKYYAETPLMFPAMPTATTTPQQAIQQNQESPTKRRRFLSETEEYIEYLKNKEDITLTITPKNPTITTVKTPPQPLTISPVTTITRTANENHFKQTSPKHPQDFSFKKHESTEQPFLPFRSVIQQQQQQQQLFEQHPITTTTPLIAGNTNNLNIKSQHKPISQLSTLLPLLADAASQQQYLTAPLDFSKKSTTKSTINEQPLPEANNNTNNLVRTISPNIFNNSSSNSSIDKRSSRKQAQPKKIRMPPEMVLTLLRDKYLNRLMDHKLSCSICCKQRQMLVFNYHTKGSLALHRFWKHRTAKQACKRCNAVFKQNYSLRLHNRQFHSKCLRQKSFRKLIKSRNTLEAVNLEKNVVKKSSDNL